MKIELFKTGIVWNGGLDHKCKTEAELLERVKRQEGENPGIEIWADMMRIINLQITDLDRDLRCHTKRGDFFSEDYQELKLMRFYAEKVRLLASLQIQEHKKTTDLTVYGV